MSLNLPQFAVLALCLPSLFSESQIRCLVVPGPEPHLLSSCPLEKHFTSTNGVCFFAMFKNKSVILHVCLYKYILHKLATLCHVENTTFKHWAALKTSNSCLELAVTNLMDLSECHIGIV